MKTFLKFCLASICLSLSVNLFSQNFISENKVWSIVSEGGMEQPWTRTISYKFSGDSTVQQTHYKKLYSSKDEQKKNWELNSLWFERNDSVFKYWPWTSETILVYDFNIAEKDSFHIDEFLTIYVDSVRVKEWGGKMRKHWYFVGGEDYSSITTVWVEGVGNINNFTRSSEAGITGGFNSILCFEENGELVYQNPEYNSCYINTKTYDFTADLLWTTMSGPSCGYDGSDCRSYYTKITGDTTINETQYKRVVNSTGSTMDEWSLAGFIRQENQKYFLRKTGSETDCLLYDFGCSEGDTLNLNCWCTDSKTHFKVDSIRFLPVMGVNRKHIYLSYLNNSSNEIWIEGIGSLSGLLNGGGRGNCMTGFHEGLLCCSKNGEKIYQYSKFADCNIGSLINNSEYKNINALLRLYPNPANNKIAISNPSNIKINKIELFDFSGRVVQMWVEPELAGNHLNIQHILPGIYLIKAETEAGIKTEKLVVQ